METSNYQFICDEIRSTAIKCGRNPSEITLIAVTKQINWQRASALYMKGQRDFGENRVPEALAKQIESPTNCNWHFIGNLQKNKVRKIVGNFSLIHSIDSIELAKHLSEVSIENNLVTNILLQTNTSGETSKHGFSSEQLKNSFKEIKKLKGLNLNGLMTMAPFTKDEKTVRACFSKLRELRDELGLFHLSMGMSNDFKIAIEEGATLLRIGSALWTSESS